MITNPLLNNNMNRTIKDRISILRRQILSMKLSDTPKVMIQKLQQEMDKLIKKIK